ncbi:hypothetical protein FACS1894147_01920 [Spirochaetia bacterium]|nr:hypothetical protein FACS1894147_01920 [Spirochaetia bacterium]
MTIQQTVDIPADRHVRIDVTLPEGAPRGQTTMVLTFTPAKAATMVKPPAQSSRVGFLKGQIEVPADFDTMGQEAITALFEGSE